jgi:hypothetical protein
VRPYGDQYVIWEMPDMTTHYHWRDDSGNVGLAVDHANSWQNCPGLLSLSFGTINNFDADL